MAASSDRRDPRWNDARGRASAQDALLRVLIVEDRRARPDRQHPGPRARLPSGRTLPSAESPARQGTPRNDDEPIVETASPPALTAPIEVPISIAPRAPPLPKIEARHLFIAPLESPTLENPPTRPRRCAWGDRREHPGHDCTGGKGSPMLDRLAAGFGDQARLAANRSLIHQAADQEIRLATQHRPVRSRPQATRPQPRRSPSRRSRSQPQHTTRHPQPAGSPS